MQSTLLEMLVELVKLETTFGCRKKYNFIEDAVHSVGNVGRISIELLGKATVLTKIMKIRMYPHPWNIYEDSNEDLRNSGWCIKLILDLKSQDFKVTSSQDGKINIQNFYSSFEILETTKSEENCAFLIFQVSITFHVFPKQHGGKTFQPKFHNHF